MGIVEVDMSKRNISIYTIIAFLAISGLALWAGESNKSTGKPPDYLAKKLRNGFGAANKHLYDAVAILKLKERLELTEQQEQKIENIMILYRETEIRKSAEIKIKELRLASYIRSESIDKKEMARHIREISNEKTDWVVSYINYLLDIRDVLTPRQLEVLSKMKKKVTGKEKRK